MRLLWNMVLIASIGGCLPDDGGEAETSLAVTAAPRFQLPFPCGMAVDLTTGPTHERALGKLLDMYRAPFSNESIQPGTPILAAADGVVKKSRPELGAGNIIRINHGGGYFT